jgi:hypothetical protein
MAATSTTTSKPTATIAPCRARLVSPLD